MTSSPTHENLLNDLARSPWRGAIRLVISSIALIGCGTIGLTTPVAATSVDKVLNATPLVLKDGRIAEVSVHTIPFPDDAEAPASNIKNDLDTFTQRIATDCFLTAQVIGHVDKKEISGRETADIHRLARARADTIQTSLIDNGLPAASIASVWDWQFMVQKPRVTLWVFRLTSGEDCENTPLGNQAEDQIAVINAPTPSVQQTSPEVAEPITAAETRDIPSTPAQQIIPAARSKSSVVTAPLPAVPAKPDPAEINQKAVKAALAKKASTPSNPQVASLEPGQQTDEKGSISVVDKGALEIVFATNSSYFPEGAGDRLRAFMKTLDKNKSYTLSIQTSVDGNASVAGVSSTDEAQRYNAWMAERRFKRVEAWLLKNSDGLDLTLRSSLIENDGSRRVRIEPAPLDDASSEKRSA